MRAEYEQGLYFKWNSEVWRQDLKSPAPFNSSSCSMESEDLEICFALL